MHRKRSTPIASTTAVLGLALACAADHAGSGPTSPAPDPAPAPAPPVMSAGTADASASVSPVDAGASDPVVADAGPDSPEASTSDAGAGADAAARTEPPLVLKGVRRCTPDEGREEECSERGKRGLCLDGYCVTASTCNRYCAASGPHSAGDCLTDPKECGGVRECVKVIQETNAQCEQLRRQLVRACVTTVCPAIRMLEAP